MPGEVVPIGSVVFALIEPTPGHELAFNDWYERDHYYTAGTAAPGVFSGGRFIATRGCKEARDPAHRGVAGDPGRGSHLALYFVLPDHDDQRVAFATDAVEAAAVQDRLFSEREHLHTFTYRPAWTWRADPAGVPPALALDHRYPVLSVAFVDLVAGSTDDDLEAIIGRLADEHGGVDLVLALAPLAEVMPSVWVGPIDPDRRRVLLFFHPSAPTDEPLVGWASTRRVLDAVKESGAATVAWASPFLAAVFGTDTHADDL